jgi:hypothetical protein
MGSGRSWLPLEDKRYVGPSLQCARNIFVRDEADGLAGQKTWRITQTTMRRYKYAIYKKCSFLSMF